MLIGLWSLITLLVYLFSYDKDLDIECKLHGINYCDAILELIHVRLVLQALLFLIVARSGLALIIFVAPQKRLFIGLLLFWYIVLNLAGRDRQEDREAEWERDNRMTLLDVKVKFMKKKKK